MSVDIASLTIAIDTLQAVRAGQDLDALNEKGAKLGAMAEFLQGKFGALMAVLGPAALGAGLVLSIKHAIELEASFVRLAQMAGTTASNISGLVLPAALAGTSLESMAAAMAKLNREVGLAKLGDVGNKSLMLQAIGIDPKAGEDPAVVLYKVSVALTGMRDQTVAAKVAFDLLGRSYAELKPALIELVNQGGIHAKVTDEEAAAAKRFQDTLVKLEKAYEDHKVKIGNTILPAFQEIADSLTRMEKRGLAALLPLNLIMEAGKTLGRITRLTESGTSAPKAFPGGAASTAGASTDSKPTSEAEENVRQLFENQKTYAARLALVKSFGEQWQEAIQLGIDLVSAEEKAGLTNSLRSQEEALLAKQKLADLGLQAAIATAKKAIEEEKKTDPADTSNKQAQQLQAIAKFEQARVALAARANAEIGVLRSQSDQALLAQAEAMQAAAAQAGAGVAMSLMTTREVENQAYAQRLSDLEAWLAKRQVSEERANKMREDLDKQHEFNLTSANKFGIKSREDIEKGGLDAQLEYYTGTLANITAAGAQHNRKLFEINKIASIANAIVSTYTGAAAALKWGWPMGPIFAGVIVAAGLASIAAINSTHFGGGAASPSVAAAAAGGATPVVTVPSTQQPATTQAGGGGITVIVQGNFIGNEQFMRDVVLPAIQAATNNKDFLLFGPNSRQAGVQSGVGVS